MNLLDMGNIDLEKYRVNGGKIHFIGCGGAGTRPLLKIFADLGFSVSGSDMAESRELAAMKEEGFKIYADHRKENLPDVEADKLLIIYSSAVKEENAELSEGRKRGAKCILRGAALGLVAKFFPCVIAVSGTHGKTSISSMILHILEKSGYVPGYLIGGNLPGKVWNGSAGDKKIFICEADESDGTHTAICSACAVVSNIEDDHIWNFEKENALQENFSTFAFSASSLVYNAGESTDSLFLGKHPDLVRVTPEDRIAFPIKKLLKNFPFYQKENAFLAAKTVEKVFQIPVETALESLQDFPGVGRRLSLHYEGLQYTLIEDYAHHPTEVGASLQSLREMYPKSSLFLLFQPHRFARLERYFAEFTSELKEKEYSPEKVFIAPVFAAWSEKGSVDAKALADSVGEKAQALEGNWEEIAEKILSYVKEYQKCSGEKKRIIIAVMGAGDVAQSIAPLKKHLENMDPGEKTGVVVAAGGSSSRYGEKNKLFEMLGDIPLFLHCLKNFAPYLPSEHIVLAVPANLKEEFMLLLEKYAAFLKGKKIQVVEGGSCREESVYNGIRALPEKCTILAVHDAARPFADHELLRATVMGAEKYGGSIAAKKVTDTIKETDENGVIVRTVDRELLRAVQTPQTFQKALLLSAFEKGREYLANYTDDSSLVEEYTSCKPVAMETNGENIKITYSEDLFFAERLLKKREEE